MRFLIPIFYVTNHPVFSDTLYIAVSICVYTNTFIETIFYFLINNLTLLFFMFFNTNNRFDPICLCAFFHSCVLPHM